MTLPANVSQFAAKADDRLTESAVLAAARSIRELQALRDLQSKEGPGAIRIQSKTYSSSTTDGYTGIPLEADEYQAVLALLIERHTIVLASLGITPDVVPA